MLGSHIVRHAFAVTLLVTLAFLLPTSSKAQIIRTRPAEAGRSETLPRTLITTFSGGISLGAYQAGVNWAILEAFRTAQDDPQFAAEQELRSLRFGAAAGASAGNINAILWAVEACSLVPPQQGPEASLFWKAWMPVGIDSLLRGPYQRGEEMAVLDRRFFGVLQAEVTRRMDYGSFRAPCQVPIGITLTRIIPDTVRVRGNLKVRSQRFVTAMVGETENPAPSSMETDGAAIGIGPQAPRFVFHPLPSQHATDKSLGLVRLADSDSSAAIPPATLFSIVRASSAFPIAFAPIELTMYDPLENRNTKELFMDGGVFDNNPIHLANVLQGWFGEQVHSGADRISTPKATRLLYVDPDIQRNTQESSGEASIPARGGFRSVFQMLGGAIHSAREYELYALGRHMDGQSTFDPVLTTRHFPLVGERMSAFGAFLNRGFREYDFYVGVYDGLFALVTDPYLTSDTIAQRSRCGREARIDRLATALGVPAHGRAFVRHLASEELACGQTLPALELNASERVRMEFYSEVLNAHRADPVSASTSCSARGIPEWLLCFGHMEGFLTVVQSRLPALIGYRTSCHTSKGDSDTPTVDATWAELELCNLAEQAPGPRMQVLLERVLARLPAVEREVTRLYPGKKSHGAEITAEVGAFIYYSGLRPRSGLQWGDLPPEASATWAVIPAYLSMDTDGSALEVGWQPTYYLHNRSGVGFGLTGTARLNWYTDRSGARDTWLTEYYGMLGIGPRLVYRLPGATGLLMSRLEITGVATNRGPIAEIATSLFADRVRVGLRGAFGGHDLGDGAGPMFVFGLNDLNGLLYWGSELIRH